MKTLTVPRPEHRQFIVVDIENLIGRHPMGAPDALFDLALQQLLRRVNHRAGDLVTVGVDSRRALLIDGFVGDGRLLIGRGRDGADRALLDALADHRRIAERYGNVVIASGDHIFTDTVVALREAGAHVTVAALADQLSGALGRAANAWLPLLPPDYAWAA